MPPSSNTSNVQDSHGLKALSDSGRIPATSSGIGLHAGEAVSGNIGSQARQQYSISGNVVILASRIEQLNKDCGSQLLVSAEVLREAGENDHGAESGVGAGEEPRRADRDLSPCLIGRNTPKSRWGNRVRGSLRKVRALMLC